MKAKNKRIFAVLLSAAMCLGLLAGCGSDTGGAGNGDAVNEVVTESWKSGGLACLTERGELLLLKDLDGSGDAICLSTNGGKFATDSHHFTNAPADGETTSAAVFSKDGSKLYFFTDIENDTGVLHCADVSKLKVGSDKNENYLEKLTTEVFSKLITRGDGMVYETYKNGSDRLYYHDGSSVDELLSDVGKVWLTGDGKGVICWTSEDNLEYVEFGKDPVELMASIGFAWYDGGDIIYCLGRENSGGSDTPGAAPGGEVGTDYNYDRETTDKSTSGYAGNDEVKIYKVTMDGKSELVLEKMYSVEGTADGKLYYTLRYEDYIRTSNLVEDVEKVSQDLLYELDHNYIEDVRYELWCYDGNSSTLLCEDYYIGGLNFEYADGDYYADPASALWESYIYTSDFMEDFGLTDESITSYVTDILGMDSRYDIDQIVEWNNSNIHPDPHTYGIYYDLFCDAIRNSDFYNAYDSVACEASFYADDNVVVFGRAPKDPVTGQRSTKQLRNVDSVIQWYWGQRCGVNPFIEQTEYVLATGEGGTIEGVSAGDFCGALNNGKALVFFDGDSNLLSVYETETGDCVLAGENANHATISGNVLYYYEGNDLVCYDGQESQVLAEDVNVADCAAWVYADGITLALGDVADNKGTLRAYEDGEAEWIADDVTYYQRITDKEIIYIADGELYRYTIGLKSTKLADEVVEVYGAYYGGTLVGYEPAY